MRTSIHLGIVVGLVALGLSSNALASVIQADCVPVLVETNADRIVLQCRDGLPATDEANPTSFPIFYFAINPTFDAVERDHAHRVLALLTTAFVTGSTLQIRYESTWSVPKKPAICGESNCRYLVHVALRRTP